MKNNYDWEAHCHALGLTLEDLSRIRERQGLPNGQLTSRQSEQLLKALKKYASDTNSDAIAQQSLF